LRKYKIYLIAGNLLSSKRVVAQEAAAPTAPPITIRAIFASGAVKSQNII